MTATIALAFDELDTARTLAELNKHRAAVRSAYYAAFYAASAALQSTGLETKTHRGLRSLFAEHFVQTGRMVPEDAAILAKAFAVRQDADYDDGALLTEELVEATIGDVARFVQLVGEIVDKN